MTADESGARGAQDARGLGALTHQSKRITAQDRAALIGLVTLAQRVDVQLRDLDRAARGITGQDEGSLTSDAIYSPGADAASEVDELLAHLEIEVDDDA